MVPKRPEAPTTLDPDLQRRTAADIFNFAWTLLEKPDRSAREDDLMIHAAHAQRFHWEWVGDPVNHARGEWQLARVYAVLGRAEPALHHARRSLELCEANGIGDFDLAYAYEAMARAYGVTGDGDEAARFEELARRAAEEIADADDREQVLADLATLP
ncbi:MAG TPA: tetratricopeptide repeat protein [Gaiellaceae bacterium]|jgi:tetratricopeptide (TPR) repeat protein